MNNDLERRLSRVMDIQETGGFTPTGGATNRMKIMSSDLVDVLEGFLWQFVDKATLLTETNKYIGLTTPPTSTSRIWLRQPKISTSADMVTMELYEGSTFTGGTPITPYNQNRLSTNPAHLTVVDAPTGITDGTLVTSVFVGGGTGVGGTSSGSTDDESSEWVLKSETKYLIKIINDSSASNTIHTATKYFTE